jgi:hypothetical protein
MVPLGMGGLMDTIQTFVVEGITTLHIFTVELQAINPASIKANSSVLE